MASYQRWVTLSYLGCAAVSWVLVCQITDLVWNIARLPMPESLPLRPADCVGLLAAGVVFVVLRRNARVNGFANDVAAELVKVTWAPRKETVLSTGVISAVVGVCAVLLFAMDTVWGTLLRLLYR